MTDETVQIDNLPDVNDVNVMLEAIEGIGVFQALALIPGTSRSGATIVEAQNMCSGWDKKKIQMDMDGRQLKIMEIIL